MTVRVCLWSGPRNISTATMRSFAARADTAVWDEPFYGCYLRATGLDHPARDETLAAWSDDWLEVAQACAGEAPGGAAIFFQKHMCQHMLDAAPLDWTAHCRHLFLIRDPEHVAASFAATMGTASAEDLGAERQAWLYDRIERLTGRRWPVVEGVDVLADPEAMLRRICDALDIGFDPSMLSWPAGQRDTDGPWAPHWYARVEASTGFEPVGTRPPRLLPAALKPVVAACRPSFLRLQALKL